MFAEDGTIYEKLIMITFLGQELTDDLFTPTLQEVYNAKNMTAMIGGLCKLMRDFSLLSKYKMDYYSEYGEGALVQSIKRDCSIRYEWPLQEIK